MSYVPLVTAESTPAKIREFVEQVLDPQLRELHTMLRLPLPEQDIHESCPHASITLLLGLLAGVSVLLFEANTRGDRGRLFKAVVRDFYPWDTEPADGVTDPTTGADLLWGEFRNPLAHSLGYVHQSREPRRITRRQREALIESEIEAIERSQERPSTLLSHAPTLKRTTHGVPESTIDVNVEALYWGARAAILRLTHDERRMSEAQATLLQGLERKPSASGA